MKHIKLYEQFINEGKWDSLIRKKIEFSSDKEVDEHLRGLKGKITNAEDGSVEITFENGEIEYLNIDEWLKSFIIESCNENDKWHSYVKDGDYLIGKHGLTCYSKEILEEELDKFLKGDMGDEDGHDDYYDIPEGSIVNIKKLDYKGISIIKIKVLLVGDGVTPFNSEKGVKGETYYNTEESGFGSGYIEYMRKK